MLWVPLPAASYFLLHLAKDGKVIGFYLFNVPVLYQHHQAFLSGCNVLSLGSQNLYTTWCLSLTVWVEFPWFQVGEMPPSCHKRLQAEVLYFAVAVNSCELERFPSELSTVCLSRRSGEGLGGRRSTARVTL